MALSAHAQRILRDVFADPSTSKEVIDALGATMASKSSPVQPVAVTYTTGNPNYTASGAVTVANGASPTNAELLDIALELRANVASLQAILHSHGLTS